MTILFPSEDNKNVPLGYRAVERRFQKLLALAGYPKNYMRLHDLRGQYIDILHSQGVPTKLISQEVGHSSTRITNDIYSYILQDTRDVAKYAVDKALSYTSHKKTASNPLKYNKKEGLNNFRSLHSAFCLSSRERVVS